MKIGKIFGVFCASLALAACSEPSAPDAAGTASAVEAHPGERTYNLYCVSCHGAGIAGAPALGDVEAWAPRIAKGQELLLQTTIEGILPQMPARGLCSDCTDEQLAEVVDYMVQKSQ